MANYDFHHLLEPLEFESLAISVLSIREGCEFERFKDGKDGGIDSFYSSTEGLTIVQVKRYKDDWKYVKQRLKLEVNKVRKINPKRYILVLSVGLLPQYKQEIMKMFDGYILNSTDIVTSNDINAYFENSIYQQVELAYPKLWISSTNVLECLLRNGINNAIYNKSKLGYLKMKEELKTFVPVSLLYKAMEILNKNHSIIISGNPGVGKSINAMSLANYYLEKKSFEELYFIQSVNDIFQVINEKKSQVFIFDDFWGKIQFSNTYLKINDEEQILNLIDYFKKVDSKILIITTREYVLQQGLIKFLDMKDRYEKDKIILNLNDYDEIEKIDIMFKHLHNSVLEWKYIKQFYINCEKIANHRNYSPRFITDYLKLEIDTEVSPYEYIDNFFDRLDNPELFWENTFLQLSYEARLISIIISTSDQDLSILEIRNTYNNIVKAGEFGLKAELFDSAIKELSNTILNIYNKYSDDFYEGNIFVRFLNPSINDYLSMYINKYAEIYIPCLINNIEYIDQLLYLVENEKLEINQKYMKLLNSRLKEQFLDMTMTTAGQETLMAYIGDLEHQQLTKIYLLLSLYNKNKSKILFSLIKNYADDSYEKLKYEYKQFYETDMETLPGFFSKIKEIGIEFNGTKLIENYYKHCTFATEVAAVKDFEEGYLNEYEEFMSQYREKIKKNMKDLIIDDIYHYIDLIYDEFEVEDSELQLDMLLDRIPDLLHQFDLRYTKKYKNLVYTAAEREIYDYSESCSNVEFPKYENAYNKEKQNKEVYLKKSAEWLLGVPTVLSKSEVENSLLYADLNQSTKEFLLSSTLSEDIYELLYSLDYNKKVVTYFSGINISNINIWNFYSSIFDSLNSAIKSNIDILSAFIFGMFKHNTSKFHKESKLFVNSELLIKDADKLVEIGILCKRGRWYQFQNYTLLVYCTIMCVKSLDENQKQMFYDQRIWDCIDNLDNNATFYKILEQADTVAYNKYFIEPILRDFIELVDYKCDIELAKYILNISEITLIITDGLDGLSYIAREIEALQIIDVFKDFRYSRILESLGERLVKNDCVEKYFCIVEKSNKVCDITKHIEDAQFIDIIKSIDLPKKIYHVYCYIREILSMFDQGDYSERWTKGI
ncbi:MAG: restriction endonuclease [Beduini sp.]|uniref:nSTAND3 domain-containing NTPase n=1 Tax=Beduini sp. TaxID=1922300 RepID=UPI003990CB77